MCTINSVLPLLMCTLWVYRCISGYEEGTGYFHI